MTDVSSKSSALISCSAVPGFKWAQRTGGEVSVDVKNVFNGGEIKPAKSVGKPTISNIVLTAPWLSSRDRERARALKKQVGKLQGTITHQDTDANLTAIGKPETWTSCVLVRVMTPEADMASSDEATWTTEWAPQGNT